MLLKPSDKEKITNVSMLLIKNVSGGPGLCALAAAEQIQNLCNNSILT